jgi:hypothetical protein
MIPMIAGDCGKIALADNPQFTLRPEGDVA